MDLLTMSSFQAVDVPGSQYWYISPTDGALMFTDGGKANGPEMAHAGKGVTGRLCLFTVNGTACPA